VIRPDSVSLWARCRRSKPSAPLTAPRLFPIAVNTIPQNVYAVFAPVLKTGVPLRVPRVRIPVSPLRQNASKCSVFPRNPENPRGFFAFTDQGFRPIRPVSICTPPCKCMQKNANSSEPSATNTGTSAPLTAPHQVEWANRGESLQRAQHRFSSCRLRQSFPRNDNRNISDCNVFVIS